MLKVFNYVMVAIMLILAFVGVVLGEYQLAFYSFMLFLLSVVITLQDHQLGQYEKQVNRLILENKHLKQTNEELWNKRGYR